MIRRYVANVGALAIAATVCLTFPVVSAHAEISGLTELPFNLTAKADYIAGGDGLSIYFWGYANGGARAQYPGPTLIVNEGDTVTVNLTNELPGDEPVSIVFPGQEGVVATGGSAGFLAQECPADGGATFVSYTFTASQPGTYMYHSGTRPDVQIEMGLVGALIVRPDGFDPNNPTAYGSPDTRYDHEYLFLLTEMDYNIHRQMEICGWDMVDTTTFYPVYWFINGRNFPDTILPDGNGTPWLPTQPYGALARMHPGDRTLKRIIGAGRDGHPHHPHGNNVTVIAKDGRVLDSGDPDPPGDFPDLAYSDYMVDSLPGQTVDAIFEWTGKGLGWDIYGHGVDDPLEDFEYAPDHGKGIPVVLPETQAVTFGAAYSGSPFLGAFGQIPPGQGGLNLNGGYFFPWHSHHEKEIVNNDIFIGGMLTFVIIEPHGVQIP